MQSIYSFTLEAKRRALYLYRPKDLANSVKRTAINFDWSSHFFGNLGLPPKYLRKWFYNFLIYNNVPESVADFIEGRATLTVGSMHYLSKVKQADCWYATVSDVLSKMFEKFDSG